MAQNRDSFFGGALADLYARGFDVSRENPWALAQASFPAAAKSRPGITMDYLLTQANDYLKGIPQTPGSTLQPTPGTPPPSSLLLDDLSVDMSGAPGSAGPGGPGPGQVTGVSGQAIGLGLGALGTAAGVPGMISFAPGIGQLGTGFDLSAQLAGLLPENLTVTTEQGLQPAALSHTPSSVMGLIGSLIGAAFGLNDAPTAVTADPAPENVGPEGLSTVGLTGPPPGWTDPAQITMGAGDAPAGGASPSGPGPGESGPAGDEGAGGQAPKRGGMTKGSRDKISKTRVHGQEFVMNARATDRFRPALEAMNAVIPADSKHLAQVMDKAKRFFDV